MNRLIILLPFFLCACGETEVKRLIMQPSPPSETNAAPAACDLRFSGKASLKQLASEAAQIAETCRLSEAELLILLEKAD
jgi:hypothetical protein